MTTGFAVASVMQDQVRSQRAMVSALDDDTIWAVSAACSGGRSHRRRGVLSHNASELRFESWDGQVTFIAPLSRTHVRRRSGGRVRVTVDGEAWILSEPQDLRLVMSAAPRVPRRVANPSARFLGLFERL